MARRAVLIGVGEYEDEKLANLRCPVQDARGLKQLLVDKDRGEFCNVELLENCDSAAALKTIHTELRQADKDDFFLIYYSGHGKRSTVGDLYLATSDTVSDALESTALEINKVNSLVKACRCRRVLLLLDCCYSGAAGGAIAKDSIEDQLRTASEGSGIYLITASTGIQTALEKEEDDYSVFTKHLLSGIQSGEADIDGNGVITIDEMYDYLYRKVKEDSHQEPTRWSLDGRGTIVISKSGRVPRQERARNLQTLLFRLKEDERITSAILIEALAICERERDELSPVERAKDTLLNKLLNDSITPLEFSFAWVELREPVEEPVTPVIEKQQDEAQLEPAEIIHPPATQPSRCTLSKAETINVWILFVISLLSFSITEDLWLHGGLFSFPVMLLLGLRYGVNAFKIGLLLAPIGIASLQFGPFSLGWDYYLPNILILYLAGKTGDNPDWLPALAEKMLTPWVAMLASCIFLLNAYFGAQFESIHVNFNLGAVSVLPIFCMLMYLLSPEKTLFKALPFFIIPMIALIANLLANEQIFLLKVNDWNQGISIYYWTAADLVYIGIVALYSLKVRASILSDSGPPGVSAFMIAYGGFLYYLASGLFSWMILNAFHSPEDTSFSIDTVQKLFGCGTPSFYSMLILFFLLGVHFEYSRIKLLALFVSTLLIPIIYAAIAGDMLATGIDLTLPFAITLMTYLGYRCRQGLARYVLAE